MLAPIREISRQPAKWQMCSPQQQDRRAHEGQGQAQPQQQLADLAHLSIVVKPELDNSNLT